MMSETPFQPDRDPEVRHMRNPFGRRKKLHPHIGGAALEAPSPEQSVLDVHKERVAVALVGLFNGVDQRVAALIGYNGNIREAVKRHHTPTTLEGGVDVASLDPALQPYMHADRFFFKLNNEEDGPQGIYKIDCQRGRFIPSLYVETADGSVEIHVHRGRDDADFHNARIRKVFNDERVHHLETFPASYGDPFDPPQPASMSRGWLPVPNSHVTYDNLDSTGNMSLRDGQHIANPANPAGFSGTYSAIAQEIRATGSTPFPYSIEDNLLTVGPAERQVHFPVHTNLYEELHAITADIRSITP